MVKKSITLGLKIGLLITITLIAFLFLGVWADKIFLTSPLCLIIGIVAGIIVVAALVYKIIIPYIIRLINNNK